MPAHWDVNLAPPTVTKAWDVIDVSGNTVQTINLPFFTTKVDPTVGPFLAEFSQLNSTYNGAIVTVRKPMSHGIEILANYTLAKATDGGLPFNGLGSVGSQLEGQQILNPYNRHDPQAQGYSGTDVRNRFTMSAIFSPAWGSSSSSRVVKGILGGWSLAGAFTASNGTRYNDTVNSTATPCIVTGVVGTTTGANKCVGQPAVQDGGMLNSVLMNTSVPNGGPVAFQPRTSFTLPNFYNLDTRLAKQFKATERFTVEIRAELFNTLNSTIVQAVQTAGYTYAAPGSGLCSANVNGSPRTNECMVPVISGGRWQFGNVTTTTGNLLGARQAQFGLRVGF
jgi:hypothetical protein